MIHPTALEVLQLIMLVTDGFGILASWMLAIYYRAGRTRYRIFSLYVFFVTVCVIFVALTVSDVLVIVGYSQTWATLPIVRGLAFRLPLTAIECWLLCRVTSNDPKNY